MSFYENTQCPVCHQMFKDGDDIVTCPQCGTPHHRECYKQLGHCANIDKHGTDFSFRRDAMSTQTKSRPTPTPAPNVISEKPADTPPVVGQQTPNDIGSDSFPDSQEQSENADFQNQTKVEDQRNQSHCAECNAPIQSGVPFCPICGARQPESTFSQYKMPVEQVLGQDNAQQDKFSNETADIDGVSLPDAAMVVRNNAYKFMPKFISNKKIGWNWSALVFGPFYLFYRKMFRQGVLFMAIEYFANFIINIIFIDRVNEINEIVTNAINEYSSYSEAMMKASDELSKSPDLMIPSIVALIAVVVIHIVIALISDRMYRSKVVSIVRDVDVKLAQDNFQVSLMGQDPMAQQNNVPLSKSDMRKMFLARMGGTSIYIPILMLLVLTVLDIFL